MIDGLMAGRLYGAAQSRTGQNGKAFVTAKVRATSGDGESPFVNVIIFSESVGATLLALDDGDSVAHAVLTAYHMQRKRKAVQTGRRGDELMPVDGLGGQSGA